MGFLRTILERRSLNKPSVPLTSATLIEAFTGAKSATGRVVGPETALQAAAVYACVRVRAETVASLPWPVYRRLSGGGKERDGGHAVYRLLHDAPNPEMTAIELREALVGHVDLWGNAYCEIERDGRGRAVALWPLRPDAVEIRRVNDQPVYVVTLPDGTRKGLDPSQVWHVRGFLGKSVLEYAREAIGLTLGAEEHGARFFANDARPGGVLKHPNKLTEDAALRLKQSWEAAHSGLENKHRVAVLEEGVEWQSIGVQPKDAQYMELRGFQRSEIASFFRVPPHKIGDLSRATFSNIEHMAIEFVVDCIRPICVRFEQAANAQLFTAAERKTLFAEHVIDGLLRGDIESRYRAYATARQWGFMSANDIRELENMNPLPDEQGQTYLVPLNMVPADQAGWLEGPEPKARAQGEQGESYEAAD